MQHLLYNAVLSHNDGLGLLHHVVLLGNSLEGYRDAWSTRPMSREDRPHALLALLATEPESAATSSRCQQQRRGRSAGGGGGEIGGDHLGSSSGSTGVGGVEWRGRRGRGETQADHPHFNHEETKRVVELEVPCGQSDAEPLGAFNNTSLHFFKPRNQAPSMEF